MSAYYRLFWQDIQFESIKMKKGERERERRNGFRVVVAAVRLCQTHTHKSQSILIHIVRQAPSSLEPSGNHFFPLCLQVEATATEASYSL
jgi:hypothetical protein